MPRISELPFVSSGDLSGEEVVIVNQGGTTSQTTVRDIANLAVDEAVAIISGSSAFEGGGSSVNPIESIIVAVSDETTALAAGTTKVTFRMPYAFTLTEIPRAGLSTAQTSGGALTVDINESGGSILSTKLTFDNTEKTTTTAATPAVLSDSSLADDAEITVDIDSLGDGTAKGLKITLIGRRT